MRFNRNIAPVGTRALVKLNSYSSDVVEILVLEWSESGKFVKLKYYSGVESWESGILEHGSLVEILPSKKEITNHACLECGNVVKCDRMWNSLPLRVISAADSPPILEDTDEGIRWRHEKDSITIS
ncbi:MAG TPA: hypothetical protein PLP33_25930 [Leptospiraceae bacterium]|nr:hypothetical protein [Leptospiraceae bacterium]